jgi:hypothetical protein
VTYHDRHCSDAAQRLKFSYLSGALRRLELKLSHKVS